MASSILSQATDKVKDMAGAQNKKIADLSSDMKDVHDKSWKMTSDFGVKQNNTDHWLGVVSEDKTGPMLLEDPFGREKV
jgi:catalase